MAIADFTEAIALNPNLSATYMLRGRALCAGVVQVIAVGDNFSAVTTIVAGETLSSAQQQAFDRAIADFTQAIRLDPNNAVVYNERGRVYIDKRDQNKAIADCNQAIKLNPNYALAYRNRGLAYSSKKDYDKAIADYTQAIRLDLNLARAYSNRGFVYYNKGDNDRAIADYEAALRIDPNHPNARNNLELARKARGY
jgi:tetratricopeptide (TPR) repeat protein